jgi:hypothetical protein
MLAAFVLSLYFLRKSSRNEVSLAPAKAMD